MVVFVTHGRRIELRAILETEIFKLVLYNFVISVRPRPNRISQLRLIIWLLQLNGVMCKCLESCASGHQSHDLYVCIRAAKSQWRMFCKIRNGTGFVPIE